MTRTGQPVTCDEVQIAAMARLDGEAAPLTSEAVDAHVRGCETCRTALARLTEVHAQLNRAGFDDLDIDLWPAIHQQVASRSSRVSRETTAIFALAIALAAWRTAQLLVELPAPVVNSILPLAVIVLVLRQLTGDPFAIRADRQQLRHGGAA